MAKFNSTLLAAAAIAAMSASVQPAAAAIEHPWCAQYADGEEGGGKNCGFVSYEQCMMTVRGMGGSCVKNLFYLDQQAKQPRATRGKHRAKEQD